MDLLIGRPDFPSLPGRPPFPFFAPLFVQSEWAVYGMNLHCSFCIRKDQSYGKLKWYSIVRDLTIPMNSYAGFVSDIYGFHDLSCEVSPQCVVVISDVFYVKVSIAFMDTVGKIEK